MPQALDTDITTKQRQTRNELVRIHAVLTGDIEWQAGQPSAVRAHFGISVHPSVPYEATVKQAAESAAVLAAVVPFGGVWGYWTHHVDSPPNHLSSAGQTGILDLLSFPLMNDYFHRIVYEYAARGLRQFGVVR